MPEKPIFGQLRDLDQAVEREIAKYLDQHLYNAPTFESIERISDENAQKRGKVGVGNLLKSDPETTDSCEQF